MFQKSFLDFWDILNLNMKKWRNFIRDVKKYGFKYAFGVNFIFNDLWEESVIPVMRKIHSYFYDYCYEQHLRYEYETEDEIEEITTPCGCTIFNDCRECSSYSVCASCNDI